MQEFLNVLIHQFEFIFFFWGGGVYSWIEDRIYKLTYSAVIFYLLFGVPMTNFGSLSRDSLIHPMLITASLSFFVSEVTDNLITTSFYKIEEDRNEIHRPTEHSHKK